MRVRTSHTFAGVSARVRAGDRDGDRERERERERERDRERGGEREREAERKRERERNIGIDCLYVDLCKVKTTKILSLCVSVCACVAI